MTAAGDRPRMLGRHGHDTVTNTTQFDSVGRRRHATVTERPDLGSRPVMLVLVSVPLLVLLLISLGVPHLGGGHAWAQSQATSVPPEAVSAIARELNCPICQGYSLQDCPLEVCAQMRDLIRERLAAGATPDEIKTSFVEEYGPQVLNAPPARGVFLSVWLLPVVALAVGAIVVALIVRRGVRYGSSPTTASGASGVGADERSAATGPDPDADEPASRAESDYAERLEHLLRADDS